MDGGSMEHESGAQKLEGGNAMEVVQEAAEEGGAASAMKSEAGEGGVEMTEGSAALCIRTQWRRPVKYVHDGGLRMLKRCRKVQEFEKLNKIDEGMYGVVYRARDMQSNEVVALKQVKMEREKGGFPVTSMREVHTLLRTKHENIVDLKEVVVGKKMDSIFLVMEFLDHELKDLMEAMKAPFSPSEVKCLMLQLLSGVAHMHRHWIIHRDLKTSNLLLNNRGILKICDFGLAREYAEPLKAYTQPVVTLWYRAPELLLGVKEYSTAVDMWSVGCIFAELLNGSAIFTGYSEMLQLDQIFKTLGTVTEERWPGLAAVMDGNPIRFKFRPERSLQEKFPTLSSNGIDLLHRMLEYDPEKRISAEDALAHPYFKEQPTPQDPAMMPTFPSRGAGRSRPSDRTSEGGNYGGLFNNEATAHSSFRLKMG